MKRSLKEHTLRMSDILRIKRFSSKRDPWE